MSSNHLPTYPGRDRASDNARHLLMIDNALFDSASNLATSTHFYLTYVHRASNDPGAHPSSIIPRSVNQACLVVPEYITWIEVNIVSAPSGEPRGATTRRARTRPDEGVAAPPRRTSSKLPERERERDASRWSDTRANPSGRRAVRCSE